MVFSVRRRKLIQQWTTYEMGYCQYTRTYPKRGRRLRGTNCLRALKENFEPFEQKNLAEEKLRNLKQRGNVESYIYEFNDLVCKTNLSEKEKVKIFIEGLKDRNQVGYEKPGTLSQAKATARRRETYFEDRRSQWERPRCNDERSAYHEKRGMYDNYGDHRDRSHPNRYMPYKDKTPSPHKSKNRWNEPRTQSVSGMGQNPRTHYGFNKPGNEDRRKQGNAQESKKEMVITCYSCGEIGHIATRCPKRQPQPNRQANLVQQNLEPEEDLNWNEGKVKCSMMLDSGADSSEKMSVLKFIVLPINNS